MYKKSKKIFIFVYICFIYAPLFAQIIKEKEDSIIKFIHKNENFQLYYNEVVSLCNLYRKAVEVLSEKDFNSFLSREKKGGYYYNSQNDYLQKEYNKNPDEFIEKIKQETHRRMDSIVEKMLQLSYEERLIKLDSSNKYMEKIYNKDAIYLKAYLKVSPHKVLEHSKKIREHTTEILDIILLDGTVKPDINLSYLLEKIVSNYESVDTKNNCTKNYRENIKELAIKVMADMYFDYNLNYTFGKDNITIWHSMLLKYAESYRTCNTK